MRKGLIIAVSVLLALLIIIPSVFYIIVQRSYSVVDGTVHLKGLKAEVDVYRDSWGVPHIYAQNEEDLFFAQERNYSDLNAYLFCLEQDISVHFH